jgi:hypothetical protein
MIPSGGHFVTLGLLENRDNLRSVYWRAIMAV